MEKKVRILLVGVFCLVLLLAGCAPQAVEPSAEMIQTAIAQTQAAEPTETPVPPTLAPTRTPAPSPTAYETPEPTTSPPINGEISAAFLNLRTGPSTLFDIVNTFVEGTAVTALSRSPDSEWVKVEIEFEEEPPLEGWMAVIYLELDGEAAALPQETFPAEQTLTGKVSDTEGNPIPGINVAFVLNYDEVDLRADATSNQNGEFTVYLPEELFGTFDVQIVSWTCESPIADANCQFSGYIQVVDRAFIAVPQEEEILFTYEKTNLLLSGTIEDRDGDPVDQMLLVAVRDDGATSLGRSDALGEFSIPISGGTWEVYAVSYDPDYLEGEKVSVEVVDTNPEAITLKAPRN
ncbi:MAG: SH3 domain-containing protein [Anaerolineales bacterium]|nr:SH3 domain-containing protein [Anaerolineales bacterium]